MKSLRMGPQPLQMNWRIRCTARGSTLLGKQRWKYWIDEKTRCNCFMLFPRALSITHSESKQYWRWHPLEETSGTEVEVATLLDVCWLEIHGRLELSHLTPGVDYNVVFEVMLTEPAWGWYTPMNLWIKFPDGTVQQRVEKLQEKPKDQWMELKAGQLKTHVGQNGELDMALFEYHVGNWKSGLTIKGVKIVPTE
ncbi:hypothetical protein PVAP13_3NG254752 [Panicum virgatum]|uniref:Protein PHLOEM PROTEIN 2-LIKE A1-like n=1 Tax=Panicum virgatum TaxID=38727 RepID=A0A8T0UM46_PANVG|nr:hypothetical protein PVAP13_3NG254752 [Panicum virgatum]